MDIPKPTSSDQLEDPFAISSSQKWDSSTYGHAPRNLDQAVPIAVANHNPNKTNLAVSCLDGLPQDFTGGVTTFKPQIPSMATSNRKKSWKPSPDSINSQLRAAAVPFRPASVQKTQPPRSVSEKFVFRDSFETPQREINHGDNPFTFHSRISKMEANHLRRERSEPEMTPFQQRAYGFTTGNTHLPPTPSTQNRPNSSLQRRRKEAQTHESFHSDKSMFLSGFNGNSPSVADSRGYFTAPIRSVSLRPLSAFDGDQQQVRVSQRSAIHTLHTSSPSLLNHLHAFSNQSLVHRHSSPQLNNLFQESFSNENNDNVSQASFFDQYSSPAPSISASSHQTSQQQLNPYVQEANDLGSTTFYQGSGSYPQQVRVGWYLKDSCLLSIAPTSSLCCFGSSPR